MAVSERLGGVSCPGSPCPLAEKPETHLHMPAEDRLPNNIPDLSEEGMRIADLIFRSYKGLAGDEDQAWADYELEREIESSFRSIGDSALTLAQDRGI